MYVEFNKNKYAKYRLKYLELIQNFVFLIMPVSFTFTYLLLL